MNLWKFSVILAVHIHCSKARNSRATSTAANSTGIDGRFLDWSESSPSGAVQNLQVFAQLATPQHVLTNISRSPSAVGDGLQRKRLKLAVTWEHPANGIPEGYDIEIHTREQGNNSTSTASCTEGFRDVFFHISYEEENKNNYFETNPETPIRYGCSYDVIITTNPDAQDYNQTVKVTYKVPDCVEGLCYCGTSPRLPAPNIISVQQLETFNTKERRFQITWNYPSAVDRRNVSSVVIRLEKLELASQRFRKMVAFHEEPGFFSRNHSRVLENLERESEYRVLMYASDEHFCEGDIVNRTIPGLKAAETVPSFGTESILSIVLPSVGTALLLSMCSFFLMRKYVRRLILTGQFIGRTPRERLAVTEALYPSLSYRNAELRRNQLGTHHGQHVMNPLYVEKEIEEARVLGAADDYEISPNRLKLGGQIGTGAYGRVYLAVAEGLRNQPQSLVVAVKQMKKRAGPNETDDFLSEISMMKHVGRHPHIVVMLGCVTLQQPYCMVLEYVPYGDLLNYLRRLRRVYTKGTVLSGSTESTEQEKKLPLVPNRSYVTKAKQTRSWRSSGGGAATSSGSSSSRSGGSAQSASYVMVNVPPEISEDKMEINADELQNFALQIVSGMEHLEQKNITHRDLAARNILVSEGGVLKISDFGLSRQGIYVNTRTRMLPLRWLAIESMKDNLYSTQSDVWAFGIVLWEICTLGGFPYASISDAALLTYLTSGNRLHRPDNASEQLYDIMLQCWEANPADRPLFSQLRALLESMEEHQHKYVDFGEISGKYGLPPTEEEAAPAGGAMHELSELA